MADAGWWMPGGEWQVTLTELSALFTTIPPAQDGSAHVAWQLRVNTGVGWGIPLVRVTSLVAAIGDVLDQPAVRRWLAAPHDPTPWRHTAIDHTEQILYMRGPVTASDDTTGFHMATRVEIAFQDLPGLRAKLTGAATR